MAKVTAFVISYVWEGEGLFSKPESRLVSGQLHNNEVQVSAWQVNISPVLDLCNALLVEAF